MNRYFSDAAYHLGRAIKQIRHGTVYEASTIKQRLNRKLGREPEPASRLDRVQTHLAEATEELHRYVHTVQDRLRLTR